MHRNLEPGLAEKVCNKIKVMEFSALIFALVSQYFLFFPV
jgi:hypothetical protein